MAIPIESHHEDESSIFTYSGDGFEISCSNGSFDQGLIDDIGIPVCLFVNPERGARAHDVRMAQMLKYTSIGAHSVSYRNGASGMFDDVGLWRIQKVLVSYGHPDPHFTSSQDAVSCAKWMACIRKVIPGPPTKKRSSLVVGFGFGKGSGREHKTFEKPFSSCMAKSIIEDYAVPGQLVVDWRVHHDMNLAQWCRRMRMNYLGFTRRDSQFRRFVELFSQQELPHREFQS